MRIVHVIDDLDPSNGGPQAVVVRLAAAQATAGREVLIVAHETPRRKEAVETALAGIPGIDRVKIAWCSVRYRYDRLTGNGAKRVLADLLREGDILHLHGVWCRILLTAGNLASERQIPYVVTPHGLLNPWSLAQKSLKKRVALLLGYRRLLRQAKFLHALNEYEAGAIRALGIANPVKILPNGISPEEIANLPPNGSFIRAHPEFGGRPYIVFLSRLHHMKGLDYMAEAFRRFAERNAEVDLVVIGPDHGARKDFDDRIARYGITKRVHVVGPLYGQEKYEALVDALCFCLPSRDEPFGIAIIEAMGAGLPVVISRHCHINPVISENDAGEVVDLDAEAIAQALLGLTGDRARRERMGQAGRRLVLARFTWPAIAEQFIAAYKTC